MTTKTTKIVVEFPDERAAVAWFVAAHADEHFPEDSALYRADALDIARGGDAGTLIVRRHGDRQRGLIAAPVPA